MIECNVCGEIAQRGKYTMFCEKHEKCDKPLKVLKLYPQSGPSCRGCVFWSPQDGDSGCPEIKGNKICKGGIWVMENV